MNKNSIIKSIILFFTVFLLFAFLFFRTTGCGYFYENKKKYKIKVGETFKIYIGQNSCCQNCWLGEKTIKSVKYLNAKLIYNPLNKNCEGCTDTFTWIFKGVKVGTDTIKILSITGGEKCKDYETEPYPGGEPDTFIVTVTD